MDLHHLRCFIAVAEEGHFGRAADRLHLSISPVSRAVKELEAQLETLLFVRSHHSVEPTPYARALLPKAIDVVARFDALIDRNSRTEVPLLRLGVSTLIATSTVDAVTQAIAEACPATELQTHAALSDDVVDLLRRDALDLVVIHLPASGVDVKTSLLVQYSFAVAMNVKHPLANRASVTVGDIGPYPLLISGVGASTAIATRFAGLLRGLGASRMKVLAQEDTVSIAGRLSHGDAVSLVALGSTHAEKTFDDPRYRLIPFDAEGLELSVGLAWTERSVQRCAGVEAVLSCIPAISASISAR